MALGLTKKEWRPEPAPFNAPRAITASAQRLNLRNTHDVDQVRARVTTSRWQAEAWQYYDDVGEVKFGFGLVASILMRLRLYVAVVVDPESAPVRLSDAVTIERPENEADEGVTERHRINNGISPALAIAARDVMRRAFAKTSLPGLMRTYSLNLAVPGECYLVLYNGEWSCRSISEVQVQGSQVQLQEQQGAQPVTVNIDDITIGRIWREHPRWHKDADSSMRGVLTDCQELLLLGRMIRASSRARLNAGILYVPDEVSVASHSVTDEQVVLEEEEDAFEREMVFALTSPINDESAGNSVVPLLLRGPGELADKIKHIEIGRKIDESLVARADRTLERILQGIDVPKDVVTGLANVKYSNAIQIDESLYKAHVEPLALVLCDAITDICIQPLLRAEGWSDEEVARVVVWYDPSEVVTRPDRAEDATVLYDHDELSGAALRAAHGFSEADAPSDEDVARKLALSAVIPPEVVNVLLKWALPQILGKQSAAGSDGAAPAGLPPSLSSILDDSEAPTDRPLDGTVDGGAAPPAAPAAAPAEPADTGATQ